MVDTHTNIKEPDPDLRPSHIWIHWCAGINSQHALPHWVIGEGCRVHNQCNKHCTFMVMTPYRGLEGRRDGDTFDPEKDEVRLNKQMLEVYYFTKQGEWRTLGWLARNIEWWFKHPISEASISARLRDFRKPRFGAHTVERRRTDVPGLFEYRLIWNEKVPRP